MKELLAVEGFLDETGSFCTLLYHDRSVTATLVETKPAWRTVAVVIDSGEKTGLVTCGYRSKVRNSVWKKATYCKMLVQACITESALLVLFSKFR